MAEESSQPELETYQGSCHCKAFVYSVKLPKLETAFVCNCSICAKNGYYWAFPPSDDLFVVEKGDDVLKDYLFGDKTMAHRFCPKCGVSVIGHRKSEGPSIGVNIRTLENVEVDQLKTTPYDGASLGSPYAAPNGPKPSSSNDSSHTYGGSCHCGKVTFEVSTKPLNELEVTECNCSICARNAYLWIYPPKSAVTIAGNENLTCYRFGTGVGGHSFCSTCGVAVLNQLHDPDNKTGLGNTQPVNLRTLNGVDLSELKVKKVDGKNGAISRPT